ncbi:MAG TPA: DUF3300 domain-containing protein [Paracoccus sp. (in: a-proteobacteria)]|uniref:DUF3300 domain-containing protein n=1 Tax=Paracoccus sp. TaxID=267 RepID=UPI002D15C0A6|nr:DUF3300 domain-containing protein [Paracoccus sp. (in: a-proteobacteria)]HWL57770.1 DUF3300 domain-containing protein [Paracoccus sp. (in: a-proteobacteria)]
MSRIPVRRLHPLMRRGLAAGLIVAATAPPLLAQDSLPCGSPHTVTSGETLSRLAARAYGNPDRYDLILDANRATLNGTPENLAVGMVLNIPCADGMPGTGPSPAMQAAIAAQGELSADELDTLFGPVALFPDQLLTPTLVATTFPLDVVKAANFVEQNEGLSDKDRAKLAASENWDDSVRELAAGFPQVVTRMSDNIDWTEQAGEAVVGQTDDVLASIQRLRGEAQKNGYLADSPAQKVETVNNKIQIAPADPDVVYVPTYDSNVVYTTPVPSNQPVYHYGYDYGYQDNTNWDNILLTGGVLLGSAVLLDDIFDDDDWHGWHHDDDIDWDRGDITINRGDRTINRGDINIDGNRIDIDRTRNSPGDRISIGDSTRPQIDRSNLRNAAGERAANRPNQRSISDPASRAAARQKIEARKTSGAKPANLQTKKRVSEATANRKPAANRQARPAAQKAAQARPAGQRAAPRASQASRPKAHAMPKAHTVSRSSNNAFRKPSGPRASAASHRGHSSMVHRSGGGRGGRR